MSYSFCYYANITIVIPYLQENIHLLFTAQCIITPPGKPLKASLPGGVIYFISIIYLRQFPELQSSFLYSTCDHPYLQSLLRIPEALC